MNEQTRAALSAIQGALMAQAATVQAATDSIQELLDGAGIPAPQPGDIRPGYCAPVGDDRSLIWPEKWVEVTGYNILYRWGWHTGNDLNLNDPYFDADAHRPVYSISDGEVYAIRKGVSGWGSVICIEHADCLSRYAHCENIGVRQGQKVEMGDYLGNIGNAGGRWPYHLHWDIARLDARMKAFPLDWPGSDRDRVIRDYLDPARFLRGK